MAGQTNIEYFWTFNERLAGLIRTAFGDTVLYSVTFQPPKGECLTPQAVAEATHCLFGDITYVLVPEQTFKQKRWDNSGDYSQNWHSHLIIDSAGCAEVNSKQVEGHDIVITPVFDLEGLLFYLSKQASRNRILPALSEAQKVSVGSEETKEPITSATDNLLGSLLHILRPPPKTPLNYKLRPYTTSTALQSLDHVVFLPNCPPVTF